MLQTIINHKAEILGVALAISEALALIPALKSNSILTLVVNGIKAMLGKTEEPKA